MEFGIIFTKSTMSLASNSFLGIAAPHIVLMKAQTDFESILIEIKE